MPAGSKPGERRGGRKVGSINKSKREMLAKVAAAGMLPHEFLAAVSQGQVIDGNVPTFEQRLSAAEKAAPYYAPRLASIDSRVTDASSASGLSAAEIAWLRQQIADELAYRAESGFGEGAEPQQAGGLPPLH